MNKELIYEYFATYLKNQKQIVPISYKIEEQESYSKIHIEILVDGKKETIQGEGVGLVDSGFDAFIKRFEEDNPSLKTISLTDVYFQIDNRDKDTVDLRSKTLMKLEFQNSRKSKVIFENKTTSMGFTAVGVLAKAFEFYINSEHLFKRMKFLVKDAESRSRPDVAAKFRYVLSHVVGVTSYQSVT